MERLDLVHRSLIREKIGGILVGSLPMRLVSGQHKGPGADVDVMVGKGFVPVEGADVFAPKKVGERTVWANSNWTVLPYRAQGVTDFDELEPGLHVGNDAWYFKLYGREIDVRRAVGDKKVESTMRGFQAMIGKLMPGGQHSLDTWNAAMAPYTGEGQVHYEKDCDGFGLDKPLLISHWSPEEFYEILAAVSVRARRQVISALDDSIPNFGWGFPS